MDKFEKVQWIKIIKRIDQIYKLGHFINKTYFIYVTNEPTFDQVFEDWPFDQSALLEKSFLC